MNRSQRRASKANGRRLMKQGWSAWEDKTFECKMRGIDVASTPGFLRIMQNNLYTVQIFSHSAKVYPDAYADIGHFLVRRNDEGPIRSWSDMQRIKNELAGPDRVAVEVYPEESNLVDQANCYHLWIMPPDYKLPFGLHMWGK
jgi:hypothetical protein